MQLEVGSTPAPGVATRRPRRVDATLEELLNGEYIRAAWKVTGEGASHGARGRARSPPTESSRLRSLDKPAVSSVC